jgi:flagellar protein FliS
LTVPEGVINMNAFTAYQETAVGTQNRGRLIVILYEGAIRFLKQALVDLEQQNYASKGINILRAVDIIDELNTVLDLEQGGQVAQNLRSLYNFMRQHLSEANVKKDPRLVREVISLLEELKQGWDTITS